MPQARWTWLDALYRRTLRRETRADHSNGLRKPAVGDRDDVSDEAAAAHRHDSEDATIAGTAARSIALDPGSRVGPYEVIEPLGAGGMGQVFRARDRKLGRDVAIKVLPRELTHDHERLARFRREAQLLASLNHPNIATVYGLEESGNLPSLVMELIPGQTLAERLTAGSLPVVEALRIGVQIAHALEAAHRQDITHRDIKPANIKVTPDGRTKVLDFGLAKSASRETAASPDMTQPGTFLGTPAYMSPEQLLAEQVSQPADVWAFGCLLYELLTGRRAFPGQTLAESVAAVLKTEPDWSALPADTPEPVRELLRRCLDKLAARRARISDAGAELDAVLRGEATSTQQRDRGVHSVAVLPFENSSGDPETEYLGDGLAESAIFSLSQLPSLRVMARGTVFRYKNRAQDPAEIGRELGVDAVLSGRVLQRGDSLVISAELIDIARGWQLWGAQYRKKSSDLLEIEQDIAKEITDALRLKLSPEDKSALARRNTQIVEAYRSYLKGRYHWGKRTEEALHKGIAYFREAIELDPLYALAYAGFAESYIPLVWYGHVAPRDAIPKARSAARKALDIDPRLAEAQTVLAEIEWWNPNRSEASLQRAAHAAIELDPTYPRAWQNSAEHHMVYDRFEEAFAQISRALELDPLSLAMQAATGMVCYYGRRYELAADYSRRSIEMDRNFFPGHWILGVSLEALGDTSGAIAELELARNLSSGSANMTANLGGAYAAAGDSARARRIIMELDDLGARRYVDQALVAGIFTLLDDKLEALSRLERAYEDQSAGLRRMMVDPRLIELRGEQRFRELARRQGFSAA